MTNNNLFSEFESISAKQWKQQIQFELKGADYNETLVPGTLVQERAFSKIEVTGPLKDRTLTITLFNVKGEVLWTKELKSNLLK